MNKKYMSRYNSFYLNDSWETECLPGPGERKGVCGSVNSVKLEFWERCIPISTNSSSIDIMSLVEGPRSSIGLIWCCHQRVNLVRLWGNSRKKFDVVRKRLEIDVRISWRSWRSWHKLQLQHQKKYLGSELQPWNQTRPIFTICHSRLSNPRSLC